MLVKPNQIWSNLIKLYQTRCKLVLFGTGHYILAPIKWETNVMESSVNDETEDGGSLLNQANAGPFSTIAKALHRMGS